MARDNDPAIPTDVELCEFLRLLGAILGQGRELPPRREWPILVSLLGTFSTGIAFARRTEELTFGASCRSLPAAVADVATLEVEVFGLSVVGGDFRDGGVQGTEFLAGKVDEFGYVVS